MRTLWSKTPILFYSKMEDFVSIGLTAKAASEVANNAALSAELHRVIGIAGEKAKGLKILHEFAVANVNGESRMPSSALSGVFSDPGFFSRKKKARLALTG